VSAPALCARLVGIDVGVCGARSTTRYGRLRFPSWERIWLWHAGYERRRFRTVRSRKQGTLAPRA
jgi:hypothetical protein